jgi:hypothetical protein
MEFKGRESANDPLVVGFVKAEFEVLRAAIRERIADTLQGSDPDVNSIPKLYLDIANFRSDKPALVTVANVDVLTGPLDGFAESTEEKTARIANRSTATPSYADRHIAERILFGRQAVQLADAIRGHMKKTEDAEFKSVTEAFFASDVFDPDQVDSTPSLATEE